MDALKKILQALQSYYDKILLGALLAGLAGVLVVQSCNMKKVNDEIDILVQTKGLPTGEIAPLEEEKLRVRLDVDQANLWQPIQRVERIGDFQLDGVSISLRSYLRTYGESGLFDPALYVYSSHDPRNLVNNHTVQNPFTGLNEQAARKGEPRVTPGDPTEQQPPTQELIPIKHVRVVKAVTKNLPLLLMQITIADENDKATWIAQANLETDGKRRSLFLRIGDVLELPGVKGSFKVVDMDRKLVKDQNDVPRESSTLTLRLGDDGPRYELQRRQYLPIGTVSFSLVALPPQSLGQAPFGIQAEQELPFPITMGTGAAARSAYYKITGQQGAELLAVATDQAGNKIGEEVYRIPRLTSEEWQKYRASATDAPAPESLPNP